MGQACPLHYHTASQLVQYPRQYLDYYLFDLVIVALLLLLTTILLLTSLVALWSILRLVSLIALLLLLRTLIPFITLMAAGLWIWRHDSRATLQVDVHPTFVLLGRVLKP